MERSKEYIPFIIMAVLFIVLTVFALLFLESRRGKEQMLLEHEVERTIFSMVETLRNFEELENGSGPVFDEDIRGFGFYMADGTAALHYGTAPERLNEAAIRNPGFKRITRKNSILYTGPLLHSSDIRPMMMPNSRMMRRPPPFLNQFVYLEMDTGDYLSRQRLYNLGFILIPLAFGAAAVYAGLLIRKNRDYRNKIVSQEQLVQLGEAARTLAHEIKNPLSAIQIRAGVLKRTVDGEALEDVRVIQEETKRLSQLVDRVREFLKSPKGDPEYINVEKFLLDTVKKYPGSLVWTGKEVKTGASGETEYLVYADTLRFRSTVENLIFNGLESYPPETEESGRTVFIGLEIDKRECRITVKDRGEGISEENRTKIFTPFFTTKTTGSGIGLAISKRFVEAAGGSLILKNNPDRGASAVITLPGHYSKKKGSKGP